MPTIPVNPELDALAVAAIKGLVMDATRKANSGHPGGPLSAADMAYVLFREFLRFDPRDPGWFNRDRFVLSAGHLSMLLYALLHFREILGMEEIRNFRQFGSKTPGHPERGATPGVEATTGPLGQGLGMAVGLAAAEAMLRERLGEDLCGSHTYVLASDGDLQEPVALGSAALAGHWGLGRLIVLYDANAVQLAGPVSRADSTDYPALFAAMGWHVQDIDGHDHAAIRAALAAARSETARPSLIVGRTVMAKGAATMEGRCEAHGAPFSPEEIRAAKEKLGLPPDREFYVPEEALAHFRAAFGFHTAEAGKWRRRLIFRLDQDESLQDFWDLVQDPRAGLRTTWPAFAPGKSVATRTAWGQCLEALAAHPLVVGGSADLDPSNMTETFCSAVGVFGRDNPVGRGLCFGVREFPMAAVVNGLALHGGLIPFGATFLTFSDYCRGALRLAALQGLPALFVFTHDSFHLGEDGPTHQSVEHAASLRLIPDMLVLRPADANETVACLGAVLAERKRPSCLLLTRQGVPVLDPERFPALAHGPRRGGYVLQEAEGGDPEAVVLASGSEVSLALDAARLLAPRRVRVVSMPCLELFDAQPEDYRRGVLGDRKALRVAVEAGRPESWHKYVGLDGLVLGLDHFGHSAPAGVLAEKYGFTPDNLARLIGDKLQTRE